MPVEWHTYQLDAWDEIVTFWHITWGAPQTTDGDEVQGTQNSFQNE